MDEMYKELPVKISPHLHMMQHVYRSTIYNLEKQCFLNTEIVVTSTQHDIEKCLPGVNCVRHMVDTDLAHTQHYRKGCPESERKKCEDTFLDNVVKDTRVWIHLDAVEQKVKNAIKNIELD